MDNVKISKAIFGFFLAVSGSIYIYYNLDLNRTITLFYQTDLQFLFLGFISLSIGYCLRVFRWSFILNADTFNVEGSRCVSPFLISITLNNTLPLRAGDVCRIVIFPKQMGLDKAHVAASVLAERVLDVFALLVIFATSLAAIQASEFAHQSIKFLFFSTLSLLSAAGVVLSFSKSIAPKLTAFSKYLAKSGYNLPSRISAFFGHMFYSLGLLLQFKTALVLVVWSLFVWIFEAGFYYFLIKATSLDLGIHAAFLITSLSSLSTLIPSAPGYFGTFHIALTISFGLLEVEKLDAFSLAIIFHSALWIFTTIPGLVLIFFEKALFGDTKMSRTK